MGGPLKQPGKNYQSCFPFKTHDVKEKPNNQQKNLLRMGEILWCTPLYIKFAPQLSWISFTPLLALSISSVSLRRLSIKISHTNHWKSGNTLRFSMKCLRKVAAKQVLHPNPIETPLQHVRRSKVLLILSLSRLLLSESGITLTCLEPLSL